MNNAEYIEITIDQIDFDDHCYIFTFAPQLADLAASIKKTGIINPPILQRKTNSTFRIISGFKRIKVLFQLKIKTFKSKIYDSNMNDPTLDLFLINFYENIGTRELNQIEKANVIHKLIKNFGLPREKIFKDYLPLLKLGANPIIIDRYLPLIDLEHDIKTAVAEEFIPIEIANSLINLLLEERRSIFNLFAQLNFGKNRQKEFLRLLQDIKAISDLSIFQIIKKESMQGVIQNKQLTSSVKINRLKEILKSLRYPEYTKTEAKFNQLKKDLKLPPNIVLRAPAFFESEKYSMELSFKNQVEFEKLAEQLKSIAEQKKLLKLEKLM